MISTRDSQKLSGLRQEHFGPKDISRLRSMAIGKSRPDWTWDFKHHHIVWIEAKPPKVLTWSVDMHAKIDAVLENDFLELLGDSTEAGYEYLLAICTLVQHLHPREDLLKLVARLRQGNLDDVLARAFPETNGWLLYNDQLEKVFSMVTEADPQTAVRFRKQWNLKSSYACDRARATRISGGSDLWSWLNHHLLVPGNLVYAPNHRGAYLLFDYLMRFQAKTRK